MFLNFGRNTNTWHSFLGLIYFAGLLCYGTALEACNDIEKNLLPTLTPHIFEEDFVQPGQYPFLAALSYPDIDGGPNKLRCGGALIHDRFVLTAATCVKRDQPTFVRLGMSNLDDLDEQEHRIDVPIKTFYVHPNYLQLEKINDIALIELENPVNKTKYIAPMCLYTENVDPPPDSTLFIAGLGIINKNITQSNALLKTRMTIVPNSSCAPLYESLGYKLQAKHLCATDPKKTADACAGASGGPLFMQVDENVKIFHHVGIISAGYGCAGSIPGLYTKVSAYLDYIEPIIWPENYDDISTKTFI